MGTLVGVLLLALVLPLVHFVLEFAQVVIAAALIWLGRLCGQLLGGDSDWEDK